LIRPEQCLTELEGERFSMKITRLPFLFAKIDAIHCNYSQKKRFMKQYIVGPWRALTVAASYAAILGSLTGCGGRPEPASSEFGTVHGTVTFDGTPVPSAILSFVPDAENGHRSFAKSDSSGAYKAMYYTDLEGVETGPCTVSVSFGMDLSRGAVPSKYSSESVLKFEVVSGENTYNIEMASK